MKSLEYWSKRKTQDMFGYMESAEKNANEIRDIYVKASRYLNYELESIFEKFKVKHKLSDKEAYRILNKLNKKYSIEELKKALMGETGEVQREILAELEAPAYASRINRLQEIQTQIDLMFREMYQVEKELTTKHYTNLMQEAYNREMYSVHQQAGIGFSFSNLRKTSVNKVLNSQWSGKNYSARIWGNIQGVARDVKEQLLLGVLTGKTHREMSREIENKFAQASSNARRLIRTESNFVCTQMDMEVYQECGIERYIYLATLDLKTSLVCQTLDLKVFEVNKQKPGENCPPMHPWCRSTTIAYIDEDSLKKLKRRARDPVTGKTVVIPEGMDYKEWYDRYVAAISDLEKGISNKKSGMIDGKVDLKYINSKEYRNKFMSITDNEKVNKQIYECAKSMLIHRNGTSKEDMYLINKNTGVVEGNQIGGNNNLEVEYNNSLKDAIKNNLPYTLISIHNHPTNIPPTGSDLGSNGWHRYALGVVACHDGTVYSYKTGNKVFTAGLFDKKVDIMKAKSYDVDKKVEHEKVLNAFVRDYGIEWRKHE